MNKVAGNFYVAERTDKMEVLFVVGGIFGIAIIVAIIAAISTVVSAASFAQKSEEEE